MPSHALHSKSIPAAHCAYPWTPDNGDGTFTNPILHADYSDPDVVRHGGDFYLTASSFNCTPGLPILHSRDLVNWRIAGHALNNVPGERYAEVQPGCGVWAPSIRFHAGKFWIFFATPDEGIYQVTATDPRGPWSDPHLVQAGKGLIDPCPLWDDDGKAYLAHAYAGSRAGIKHMLRVRPMAADGSALLGEGQIVFHAPERHPTVEGPKFLKKDGWYYLLAPAGGVETGWQLALRSRHVCGPYEDRVILETGSTSINGPHQGALVDLPNGDWWFCHFQDAGIHGRIVHLQPVEWQDGWPLAGRDFDGNGIGEPVTRHALPRVEGGHAPAIPQTSDEFDGQLGLQWQWQANHRSSWASMKARPGWLRLFAQSSSDGDLLRVANVLAQKLPAEAFTVEALIELKADSDGVEAGLCILGKTCGAIVLRRMNGGAQLIYRDSGSDTHIGPIASRAWFRATLTAGGDVRFAHSIDGSKFVAVPGVFKATKGNWIGAKAGLFCIGRGKCDGAWADFDYFRFSGPQAPLP